MNEEYDNPYNDLPPGDPPAPNDVQDEGLPEEKERDYMALMRQAFHDSTSWLEASVTKDWQDNLAMMQNRHPSSSKFSGEGYKKRSSLFWPKQRAALQQQEASWAQAAFSGSKVTSVEAENDSDAVNVTSARLHEAMLNYNLEKRIPWFLTSTGALQDAHVYNICVSYQYWMREERTVKIPIPEAVEGEQAYIEERVITTSKPCIDLLAPENVRIDPACDWRDPINSSPYLIRIVPMYVTDVIAKAKDESSGWVEYNEQQLIAAQQEYYDTTRREREEDREDSHEVGEGEFTTVFLHENFVRIEGEEKVFWSVGTQLPLSDVKPLDEVYLHGERPLTMGYVSFDAHRTYPDSPFKQAGPIQESLNELNNQRRDNVNLVLNKRYFLRRGQQVDLGALMRNVPGGGVMMDDPFNDVRIVETPDVTGSSYNEQDRMNVQFDEIFGTFSQSSVQSNRTLNETVGGMNLLSGSAGLISEYRLRTFVETWVEPTLRQVVKLQAFYEDDRKMLALAGESAGIAIEQLADEEVVELLLQDCLVRVSVGMGATSPQQKVERLMMGVNSVANLPRSLERLKEGEIASEVFHSLGYRDASRFYIQDDEFEEMQQGMEPQQDPEMVKLEMQMQLKQMELEKKAEMRAAEIEVEREEGQLRAQLEYAKMQQDGGFKQAQINIELQKLEDNKQLRLADIAARHESTMATLQNKLGFESQRDEKKFQIELLKDKTKRETTALTEQNKANELQFKKVTGREGI